MGVNKTQRDLQVEIERLRNQINYPYMFYRYPSLRSLVAALIEFDELTEIAPSSPVYSDTTSPNIGDAIDGSGLTTKDGRSTHQYRKMADRFDRQIAGVARRVREAMSPEEVSYSVCWVRACDLRGRRQYTARECAGCGRVF